MRFYKNYISPVIIALVLLTACSKNDVDFLGPSIAFAPEGFEVVTFGASTNNVDFSGDSVVFNASFSHSVSWVLTVEGETSGALREYSGLSGDIEDLVWKGGQSEAEFFRTGETVTATLSFFGTEVTSTQSIDITTAPDLTMLGLFPRDGDFEDDAAIDFPSWARFNVVDQGTSNNSEDYNGEAVPSVEGESYYYIKGLGTQDVFVDGIQFLGPWTHKLPENADSVYLNLYVYGTGDANGRLDIELQEEDFDGGTFGYTGTEDDAFVATIFTDHKGWKLFSFKYSDLQASANADFGGSGNKVHEPHNMKSVVFVALKATTPDAPIEIYFDYPIWTVGGPFDPSKL